MIGQLSYFKIAAFFSGIFIVIQPSLMPEQQPKWSSSKNEKIPGASVYNFNRDYTESIPYNDQIQRK